MQCSTVYTAIHCDMPPTANSAELETLYTALCWTGLLYFVHQLRAAHHCLHIFTPKNDVLCASTQQPERNWMCSENRRVAPLVADPPHANSTTRQNTPICNPPLDLASLYIALIVDPIMIISSNCLESSAYQKNQDLVNY